MGKRGYHRSNRWFDTRLEHMPAGSFGHMFLGLPARWTILPDCVSECFGSVIIPKRKPVGWDQLIRGFAPDRLLAGLTRNALVRLGA